MNRKNILLIGKNGQLGRALINNSTKLDKNFYKLSPIGRETLDLATAAEEDYDKVFNYFEPSLVINTAAFTEVDKAELMKDLSLKVNGESLKTISKECKKREIPLIHFSTDYIFNGLGSLPWQTNFKANPINYYGETKLVGENHIKKSGIKFIIFRVSWVFGYEGKNFVKTMINFYDRKELKIVSDQFGGPTSAEYIAIEIIKLIPFILRNQSPISNSAEAFPWGVYHLQGQPIVNWFGFADMIFKKSIELKLFDISPKLIRTKTKDYKTLASRPLNSRLDCNETKSKLGISQPFWENDLNEYLINFLTKR